MRPAATTTTKPASPSGAQRRPRPKVIRVEPGYPDEWRVDLHNVTARLKALKARQDELVAHAIVSGATWSAVASVLGISRQSAQQRFRHVRAEVVRAEK